MCSKKSSAREEAFSNMNMENAKPQKKVTPEHSNSSEFSTSSSLNKELFLNLSTNT